MQNSSTRNSATWLFGGLLAAMLSVASGQSGQGNSAPVQPPKPVRDAPRPQDLEPGVNTSATSPSADAAAAIARPTPQETPSQAVAVPPGNTSGKASAAPAARKKSHPAAAAPSSQSAPGVGTGKAHDRIELDTTQITGNRELPKVLYIVPWKRSDLGDLLGKPVNSLVDEVLTPIDRDVFKRQNRYYDALKPDAPKEGAAAVPAPGEKP